MLTDNDKLERQEKVIRRLMDQIAALKAELARYMKLAADELDENAKLREALELIATPKRSDGTYNRCREACEDLDKRVLETVLQWKQDMEEFYRLPNPIHSLHREYRIAHTGNCDVISEAEPSKLAYVYYDHFYKEDYMVNGMVIKLWVRTK